MGGAQPLAATMAGASMLAVECQQSRIDMRLATRYLDRQAGDLDDALAILREAGARRRPVSVGLLGNACGNSPRARAAWRAARYGDRSDIGARLGLRLSSAGWTVERWRAAQADPAQHATLVTDAKRSIVAHVRAMLAFHKQGIPTFDYGNNIRQVAEDEGRCRRVRVPGIRPRLHPPALLRGARARSAGSRSRATPRTSTRPIGR
jgi:urocanate hydratase